MLVFGVVGFFAFLGVVGFFTTFRVAGFFAVLVVLTGDRTVGTVACFTPVAAPAMSDGPVPAGVIKGMSLGVSGDGVLVSLSVRGSYTDSPFGTRIGGDDTGDAIPPIADELPLVAVVAGLLVPLFICLYRRNPPTASPPTKTFFWLGFMSPPLVFLTGDVFFFTGGITCQTLLPEPAD